MSISSDFLFKLIIDVLLIFLVHIYVLYTATNIGKKIYTKATLFRENYVNCLCKTCTAVSESWLTVAHALFLHRIELLKKNVSMIQGSCVPNLVKIGSQITSQSCPQTPDGRTDGRLRDFTFCPKMRMHCIGQTVYVTDRNAVEQCI